MNIAILHFHLRLGGVTSVIHKQISGISKVSGHPQIAVLSGTPPEVPLAVPFFLVPNLDYDTFTGQEKKQLEMGAQALAQEILDALSQAFPSGCDLLHVHNPLLCKNARLVGALAIIQSRGVGILIQAHDMAEDYRPQVYEDNWPYPENCDYVVINQRDRNNLVASGLSPEAVHFLPNPVTSHENFSLREGYQIEASRGRMTALYPVRGIRRKNLGEALFLSLFLPKGGQLAVTLPPTSPGDLVRYGSWKSLAADRNFPVQFELGNTHALTDLYQQAFCVVTTSVKEGFGYSYLDPLMRGVPVKGRAIPYLIEDFSQKGIKLPGLYSSIWVPRKELSQFALDQGVHAHLGAFRRHYGPIFETGQKDVFEALMEALGKRFTGDLIDFGALDESVQSAVLIRLHGDRGFRQVILGLNPFLDNYFEGADELNGLQQSRDALVHGYGEEEYARDLVKIYQRALQNHYRGKIDKSILLCTYLKPESFFMVAS